MRLGRGEPQDPGARSRKCWQVILFVGGVRFEEAHHHDGECGLC